MEEPLEIERWKRISVLGSGAFGIVTLWQHTISDDYIAIKKCKFQTSGHLSERQRERWENEVNIMQTLNCPNIVSFRPLPKHLEAIMLKYNPTKLPLLSMEYCKKGNLRHVLNQPKNSTGLQESDLRIVLADVTKAVSYLHQHKITHRDIKPENIVLQECGGRPGEVIYKLIDLGYAKELNDSVVSFVGTLHYLAPEIMQTENYGCTVDYWSLGIVAFEIICGVLPFLPQYTPVERFQYIVNKKPEHICIYQRYSGSVAYSSELKENHISTCLKQNVESWLRHVLQFDPLVRGTLFPDNTNVFDNLLNILDKKIVIVFSVYTLEFYSYEINESVLISTLKDWLARDTKVQKDDQILLSNLEILDVRDDKYVVDLLPEDDSNLFVFKKGAFTNRETPKFPKYVTVMFQNPTAPYKWRELRLMYAKSLFFLSQQHKLLTSLVTAFNLYICYTNCLTAKLKTSMKQLHKTVTTAATKIDCYCNLHSGSNKCDMDRSDTYKRNLSQFQQLLADFEKCVTTTNKLLSKVDILSRRQVILEQVLPKVTPLIKACDISNEVARATDLIGRGGNNEKDCTPIEMVKIVSNAFKIKDKLLNNKYFESYAMATSVAIRDINILQTWMDGFHKRVAEISKAIDDNQKEHYNILLVSAKRKQVNLVGAYSNHFVRLDTDVVIRENQDLRCQFEDTIGRMLVDYKKICDEIQPFKMF
jgi:inhibitor of nuclear factor kappa-B kinase subunit beta